MNTGRKHWICKTDDFARKYPAALMFFAVCTVCIPGLHLKQSGFSVFYIAAFAIAGLAIFSLLCCSMRNAVLRILIPGCLAACSICYHDHVLRQEPLLETLHGESGYGEGVFRITDDALATDLPFLYQRRRMQAEILKFRRTPDQQWREVKAKVTFLLPKENYRKLNCGYGDILFARGDFLRHSSQIDAEGFDYRQWLERQKIFYEFRADTVETIRIGKGYHRFLYDMRSRLLKRICAHVHEPEVRALIPGLFFGLRSAAPETLKDFRASGMIHIISVSGTHVSLFALVLFLILLPIPYRIRYSIVIFLTFLYAESTGMRIPAFRAFLMFALYCGLRMFQLRTLTLNTLFLAAVILTLLDPAALLQAGFQFSFLAVAALLLLSSWQKYYAPPETERMLLTPSRMISPRYVWFSRVKHKLLLLVLSCLVAWLISLPLTLYHQGMWSVGGPAANLFSAPFITLSFVFFAGCCIFCFITPLLACCAGLLTLCLQCVCAIAGVFAESGDWMRRPPLWLVIVFICLILFFLSGRRKLILTASGAVICIFLLFWSLQRIHREPEILLFTDGTEYAICVFTPENKTVNVISLPDEDFVYNVLWSCTVRQIERCGILLLPTFDKHSTEVVEYFRSRLPVFAYSGPELEKREPFTTYLTASEEGPFRILRTNVLECIQWEDRLYVRSKFDGGDEAEIFIRRADHAITVKIHWNDGRCYGQKISADGRGIRLIRCNCVKNTKKCGIFLEKKFVK